MKFTIDIAQDIRAYGTVEVEADSMDAAIAKVDKEFVINNFSPHGAGSDDYDFSDPRSVWLGEVKDADGEYIDMADVELPDEETTIRPFTPLVMLHGQVSLPGETVHWDGDNGHNGKPDGWNVWLRRDYHDHGKNGKEPFDDDTAREMDFANDDHDGAMEYARILAAELQCEIEEY